MLRRAILPAMALIAIFATCAVAEQTLTITLDPSAAKKDDIRLNHETTGATRENSSKQASAQQYRVETQSKTSGKETPIGRVGVVISAKADIKSSPSSKGYTYYTCPKDTYIAILGDNHDWYGVLMSNGSTGWIAKKSVSLLDYQVVSKQSPSSVAGSQIVNTALKYLGIPYVWGGYSFSGLDCSGFVKAVFASHGINLPRVARDQANSGAAVPFGQLQAGDRLYFACKGSAIDHAGIYMGNGMFVHSSSSRGGVGIDNLFSSHYTNWLVTARRS